MILIMVLQALVANGKEEEQSLREQLEGFADIVQDLETVRLSCVHRP